MTDHDALLATILAHPDDDLPRLVFADFLEESGDAERAEFIRVQCELARLAADDPDRAPLDARAAELLDGHRAKWVVPGVRGQQRFRRGFVEAVHTTAEWFVASAEKLLASTPLQELRVVNLAAHLDEFTRRPGLARLRALDLSNNNFAGGLHLERLLNEGSFGALTSLTIRNAVLWPSAVEIIANAPVAPRLLHLDLSGNPIADAGAQMLAGRESFAGLRELVLRNDELPFYDSVHAAGAGALAQSRTLTRLRVLNLSAQYTGGTGLIALVGSPNAASLEVLDVSDNEIGPLGERAVEALVESPHLANLKWLHLGSNPLNSLAIQTLATWPRLADGVRVDLRETELDAKGRAALLASPWADRFLLDP